MKSVTRLLLPLGFLAALSVLPVGVVDAADPAAADTRVGPSLARQNDPPSPAIGSDAPALSLKAYNEEVANKLVGGASVSVHNFVGVAPENPHQAVVVHFFSIDNARSVQDLPVLQKLYKKYKDEGVMILSICVDPSQQEKVYSVIEESRVLYPVLRDRFGVVARRYGIRKLPSLMLVDAQGRVVAAGEGYSNDLDAYLDAEIRALLNEQAKNQ